MVLGTLIALVCLLRHQAYRRTWQQTFAGSSGKFEPWLAFVFATGAVATGVVLTIILLLYRR